MATPTTLRFKHHMPVLQSRRRCFIGRPSPFLGESPCIQSVWEGHQQNSAIGTSAPGVAVAERESRVPASDASSETGAAYPWTKQWYPVGIVENLDPCRPHAAHLLGINLALWCDKQGNWHAVEDKCPHRLAPLSEGRVESDGTLQCAYHGWQFNGQGACTHIPQLRGDDKAQQAACASRRSCVRSFPTQVVHGLVWVLPDSSQEAHNKFADERTVPGMVLKELLGGPESEGWVPTTPWFTRDLAVRFDTLMENVMDPSHVPFAHHGVQGRRSSEKGTTTKVIDGVKQDGFTFEHDSKTPFRTSSAEPVFSAPGYVRYSFGPRALNVYAVPTCPGWSRLYSRLIKDTRRPSPFPWLFTVIMDLVDSMPWVEHTFQRNAVLDGDTYMLHVQERLLMHKDGDWERSFFMPAAADGSVIGMRRWFDKFGGAVPTCEPGAVMPPQMTKREVLDRYSQHTVHCKHCQKALRNVDLATAVAAAGAVLAAVWLFARLCVGLPLLSPAAGVGLLALAFSGAAVAKLRELRQQFIFVNYVHAERN